MFCNEAKQELNRSNHREKYDSEIYQLWHMIVAPLCSYLILVTCAGMAFSSGVSTISITHGSSSGHRGFSDSNNYIIPSSQDVASMRSRTNLVSSMYLRVRNTMLTARLSLYVINVFESEKY